MFAVSSRHRVTASPLSSLSETPSTALEIPDLHIYVIQSTPPFKLAEMGQGVLCVVYTGSKKALIRIMRILMNDRSTNPAVYVIGALRLVRRRAFQPGAPPRWVACMLGV